MTRPVRIALLNPNTNRQTTDLMAAIARGLAPDGVEVEAHTMSLGPAIVTDEAALAKAALQIVRMGVALASDGVDAILISGFGDPGLDPLKKRLRIPVTGIAEAGMAEAGAGRRFSIVTTTPELALSIHARAIAYSLQDNLVSVRITDGPAEQVMATQEVMTQALIKISQECEADGAEAIVIGGGPLAIAAQGISAAISLPVIEPVAAGMRLTLSRLGF